MNPLRVLIVEDEPTNREIAEAILTTDGHSVTTCRNGEEALDLCIAQGVPFDLVLMDILMPNMDGLEVTRRLRSESETRNLAILCVSARAAGADHAAGLLAGCDHYLKKPYRRKDLLEALRDTLEKRALAVRGMT